MNTLNFTHGFIWGAIGGSIFMFLFLTLFRWVLVKINDWAYQIKVKEAKSYTQLSSDLNVAIECYNMLSSEEKHSDEGKKQFSFIQDLTNKLKKMEAAVGIRYKNEILKIDSE